MSAYLITTLSLLATAVVLAVIFLQRARTAEARALEQWRARHLAESDARIAAKEGQS